MISSNTLLSARVPTGIVVLLLALLVLALRAPFWFPVVINWDESTFIIVAQSMLEGQMLYDDTWDMKPPLVFSAVAAFLSTFGKSIVAVRVGGALLVLATALFVYGIARRLTGQLVALLSAAAYVVAASLLYDGQATLSEHIAVLPLMAGLSLLVAGAPARSASAMAWRGALLGLLISAACLARLNLAFLAIAVGLLWACHPGHQTVTSRIVALIAYGLGGMTLLGATIVPYLWSDSLAIWWQSMVLAPLAYTGAGDSWVLATLKLAKRSLEVAWSALPFALFFLGFGAAGLAYAVHRLRRAQGQEKWALLVLIVVFATTLATAIVTGHGHSHYLLQVAPFLAIFAGIPLTARAWPKPALTLCAVAFLGATVLAFRPVVLEAGGLIDRIERNEALVYGDAVDAAAFIRTLGLQDDASLFAMSDHIVYWMLDKTPPTRAATHPSNIFKPAILAAVYGASSSPASELAKIFASRPTLVLKRQNTWYMRDFAAERAQLERYLQDYDLVYDTGSLEIYLRADAPR